MARVPYSTPPQDREPTYSTPPHDRRRGYRTPPIDRWYEALPGFWLPPAWVWTEEEWPDYTVDAYVRALSDTPDISEIIVFRDWGQPSKKAWGAWFGAQQNDTKLNRGWPDLEIIAGKMYESARYKYLVPAWRRALVELVTDLDNIEDQLSTILWVLETVSKKFIRIPPGWLDVIHRSSTSLDCAGKLIAGIGTVRGSKSKYADCLAEVGRDRKKARAQRAGLLAWFQENWGRLIEAAQASGTWFDVGIVLGPIMAYIDEGMWGVIKKTQENYLLAADALFPGYAQWAAETDAAIAEAIQGAWDETWGAIPPDRWDNVEEYVEP